MSNELQDSSVAESVKRLTEVGLVLREGEYLTLQRPEYSKVSLPEESLRQLHGFYAEWLHAEQASIGEQLLYGQNGFWQHWWNLLHEQHDRSLYMDLVLPDVPEIDERDWMGLMNAELLRGVMSANALKLRLLLPPREPSGTVGDLAEFTTDLGFEVRVKTSPFLFAVYQGKAAVVSEHDAPGSEEGYFLTRRASFVGPLQQVFNEQWESAVTWEAYSSGTSDVLELMALGWTDARIADAMGMSTRTLSRRIADAMDVAGVSSRFELGMKFAQRRET